MPEDSLQVATFGLTVGRTVGKSRIYSGKVFEIGDYPDKAFSLNEDEADAAIAEFAPVPNDLEHVPTIVSGKIGQVFKVWREGAAIFGDVQIPEELITLAGDGPISTSLTWHRASKRIIGNALVIQGRIPDAKLVAAFAASEAPESGSAGDSTEEPKPMTIKERIAAAFAKFGKEIEALPDEDGGTPAAAARVEGIDPAEFARVTERNRQLEADKLAADKARVGDKAAEFADSLIKDAVIVPAERDEVIAAFTEAVAADNAGAVCFSADGALKEGALVKFVRKSYEAKREAMKPENILKALNGKATFGSESSPVDGAPTDARIKELLSHTSVGQDVIKEKK